MLSLLAHVSLATSSLGSASICFERGQLYTPAVNMSVASAEPNRVNNSDRLDAEQGGEPASAPTDDALQCVDGRDPRCSVFPAAPPASGLSLKHAPAFTLFAMPALPVSNARSASIPSETELPSDGFSRRLERPPK